MSAEVDRVPRDVCLESVTRDGIVFLEIGTDRDHVPSLVQTIPAYSPTRLVRVIKRLTAREVIHRVTRVKRNLWVASPGRTATTSAPSAETNAAVIHSTSPAPSPVRALVMGSLLQFWDL